MKFETPLYPVPTLLEFEFVHVFAIMLYLTTVVNACLLQGLNVPISHKRVYRDITAVSGCFCLVTLAVEQP